MLTGRSPLIGASLQETLVQIREKEVPSPRLLDPRIPRDLETIYLKCLQKEPARRYATAKELADELGRFLEGKLILARPISMGARTWRWCRRNPAIAGLSATLLLALLGGTVASTLFALGQSRARAEAEQRLRLATAVSDFLRQDLLLSMDPFTIGRASSVRSLLEAASARLNRRFAKEPEVEGLIRRTLGWIYRGLGDLEVAERELQRAHLLLRDQLGADHPDTLKTERYLALVCWEAGRYPEGERIARRAFQGMRRVLGPEHEDTLWCLNEWGLQVWELGRYPEAAGIFQELWATSQRVMGPTNSLTLLAKGNLAHVYRDTGRWPEAEALYLEKLQVIESLMGAGHPYTLNTLQALADLHRKQGRAQEARDLLLRALNWSVKVLGPEHRWHLSYQCSLGGARFAGQNLGDQPARARRYAP